MTIANSAPTLTILENGDRLNRLEFERRYTASKVKKAELIEGLVYLGSSVRFNTHAKPHGRSWLGLDQALVS